MSRRDTILIAVIINAGLLAILLATAIIYEPDKTLNQTEVHPLLVEAKPVVEPRLPIAMSDSSGDEVDRVLNSYHYQAAESSRDVFINEPLLSAQSSDAEESSQLVVVPPPNNASFIEVTVKKGDVLEKIARANGTTVAAIKKANHLQSERLQIGQVLKIPLKKEPSIAAASSPSPSPSTKKKEEVEGQYYIVKTGDNPWKIAKQFNLKFDDIVRLNHLDEERARNLKAGDKIRIK